MSRPLVTDLSAHRGSPEAVTVVCVDMSPVFIRGVTDTLPRAAITFRRSHAGKIINDAADQVRRTEHKGQPLFGVSRYVCLRNPANLSERPRAALHRLPVRHLKTAHAYPIRLAFQEPYDQPSTEAGGAFLGAWYF
ncbi:MAG TPA: transposase [Acetobacteraceae bacterium]|nr:transposase [Acetobacteraceae bacterium]